MGFLWYSNFLINTSRISVSFLRSGEQRRRGREVGTVFIFTWGVVDIAKRLKRKLVVIYKCGRAFPLLSFTTLGLIRRQTAVGRGSRLGGGGV